MFRTWRFPTRQQIAAGAHWVACVAILAPGDYPGRAGAKKVADQGCARLLAQSGRQGAFVYHPTNATTWKRTRADWSCWEHSPGA